MTNDPTERGLEIHADPPAKPRDVFEYVLQNMDKKWMNDIASDQAYAKFIDEARRLFKDNQAIGQDNLSESLSLRFQDGMVLVFCDTPNGMDGVGGMNGPAAQVAKDHPQRGAIKQGSTERQASWGVTGNEEDT